MSATAVITNKQKTIREGARNNRKWILTSPSPGVFLYSWAIPNG